MRPIILFTLLLAACIERHEGTADARQWLTTFYPKAKEVIVQCQEYDTDRNGYASCTAKVDDKMLAIECPVKQPFGCYYNSDCRIAKGTFVQNDEN